MYRGYRLIDPYKAKSRFNVHSIRNFHLKLWIPTNFPILLLYTFTQSAFPPCFNRSHTLTSHIRDICKSIPTGSSLTDTSKKALDTRRFQTQCGLCHAFRVLNVIILVVSLDCTSIEYNLVRWCLNRSIIAYGRDWNESRTHWGSYFMLRESFDGRSIQNEFVYLNRFCALIFSQLFSSFF